MLSGSAILVPSEERGATLYFLGQGAPEEEEVKHGKAALIAECGRAFCGLRGRLSSDLTRLSYSASRALDRVRVMANLSRWLGERHLEASELGLAGLNSSWHTVARAAPGWSTSLVLVWFWPRPMLGYLRRLEAVPETVMPRPQGPVGLLLEEFAGYLVDECGLAYETIRGYRRGAEAFLTSCALSAAKAGWRAGNLGAGDNDVSVLAECARLSRGSAANVVKALRSLLGFLYFRGYRLGVGRLRPGGSAWRGSGRSRGLEPGRLHRLASCDRRSPAGRRASPS